MNETRRILSIDGGGIRGTFPASFLATIEERLPHSIADYFDLITGTSTGGIIALALALGFSGREVLAFYETLGHDGRGIHGRSVLGLARDRGGPRRSGERLSVLAQRAGEAIPSRRDRRDSIAQGPGLRRG